MARGLFDHSYDRETLSGMPVKFTDGRDGIISGRLQAFARVRSLDGQIDHEYAWSTVAWEYVDKGKPFPVR